MSFVVSFQVSPIKVPRSWQNKSKSKGRIKGCENVCSRGVNLPVTFNAWSSKLICRDVSYQATLRGIISPNTEQQSLISGRSRNTGFVQPDIDRVAKDKRVGRGQLQEINKKCVFVCETGLKWEMQSERMRFLRSEAGFGSFERIRLNQQDCRHRWT